MKLNAGGKLLDTQQMINTAKTIVAINEKPDKATLLQEAEAKRNCQVLGLDLQRGEVQMDHERIFSTAVPAGLKNSFTNMAVSIRNFGLNAVWIELVTVL